MAESSKSTSFLRWDIGESLIALALAALGFLSLKMRWSCTIAFSVALVCDLFALVLLFEAGLLSVRAKRTLIVLPHRIAALLILCCLAVTLVCSFGDMYLESRGVCRGTEVLQTPLDAAYFSVVTMTTVGYGDYTATTEPAREIVIWQLASGFLLLLIALPIVASRLALFDSGALLTVIPSRRDAAISVDGSPEVKTWYTSRVRDGKHTLKVSIAETIWECEIQVSGGQVTLYAPVGK